MRLKEIYSCERRQQRSSLGGNDGNYKRMRRRRHPQERENRKPETALLKKEFSRIDEIHGH